MVTVVLRAFSERLLNLLFLRRFWVASTARNVLRRSGRYSKSNFKYLESSFVPAVLFLVLAALRSYYECLTVSRSCKSI